MRAVSGIDRWRDTLQHGRRNPSVSGVVGVTRAAYSPTSRSPPVWGTADTRVHRDGDAKGAARPDLLPDADQRREPWIDNDGVQIRIEASELPGRSCGPGPDRPGGYRNIHVGVQHRNRRDDLLGLVAGDAPAVTWILDCKATPSSSGIDLTGPYIQGRPGGRFIYLAWGTVDQAHAFTMFRRAKLQLDAIPPAILTRAVELGLLVGRLGLSDANGHPVCAAVRPPAITWATAPQ